MQIAGAGDRAFARLDHGVNFHSGTAQRPYGSQGAVVKGISVESKHKGGNSGVERWHANLIFHLDGPE